MPTDIKKKELPPQDISIDVLLEKYAKRDESTEDEIFLRVAEGVASVEKTKKLQKEWTTKFYNNMKLGGIGAGRIMSAGGAGINATLINCFQGDTVVPTKNGTYIISDLEDKEVEVKTLHGWKKATFRNHGRQQLWKITFDNGTMIKTTKGHIWLSINPSLVNSDLYTNDYNDFTEYPTTDMLGKAVMVLRSNGTRLIRVVTKVEETNEVEDVFCTNEPDTHSFCIEDGILTGNCFVIEVGDSIDGTDEDGRPGIYEALRQAAVTMQKGGGVGYNFSYIRPRGAEVKSVMSIASGPCSYIDIFDASCKTIESAGARRGAQLGAININHPDVLDFVKAKRTPGRWNNFNVSVLVTDAFMKAKNNKEDIELIHKATPSKKLIEEGAYQRKDGMWVYRKISAVELWDAIMRSNYDYAEPGILFEDNINNDNNLRYMEHINTTNPCVTGETKILTKEGYKEIISLIGKPTSVWNGDQWSEVTPRITGENQEILLVETNLGVTLSCTPYHTYILEDGSKVEAKDLKENDILHKAELPTIDGHFNYSLEYSSVITNYAPDTMSKVRQRINWAQSLISDIGSIHNGRIVVNCKSKIQQEKLRYFFLELGCLTVINNKQNTDKSYSLIIPNESVLRLKKLGLDTVITDTNEVFKIKVKSITKRESVEEKVYCFTEPIKHTGTFEGILTGQCGEQPLPPHGCCDLGPIILPKFVRNPFQENAYFDFESLKEVVHTQVRFLDNVLDATVWPLPQQHKESQDKRRIGVGFTGLANALAMCNTIYYMPNGVALAEKIAKLMRDEAYRASINLAKEKGRFPKLVVEKYLEKGTFASRLPNDIKADIRKYGIRNSHLLSVAPTGCATPDTLVVTKEGLVELGTLSTGTEDWQDIDQQVVTDEGYKQATKFFINGVKPVKAIVDSYGYRITATDNHQLRIIDDEGNYVWRRFDELKLGDVIVRCIGNYPDIQENPLPNNETLEHDPRTIKLKKDVVFTEGIAELVGFMMANGNIKTDKHIRLYHHIDYHEKTFNSIIRTLEEDLGINNFRIFTKNRENNPYLTELNIYSKDLVSWLRVNDSLKEGSMGIKFPNWVLRSNEKIVKAFLRGLYEGDGSGGVTSITYCSIDEKFTFRLQQVLSYLGIVARKDISRRGDARNAFGKNDIHRVSIGNRKDKLKFLTQIGFMSDKGHNCVINYEHDNIYRTFYKSVSKLLNKVFGFSNPKQKAFDKLKSLGINQEVMLTEVSEIIDLPDTLTVDISVPDNVTYIANGFVTHNTVSLAFADNASNGIEPPFSLAYTRKKRMPDGTFQHYNVLDHSFRIWLSTLEDQNYAKVLEDAVSNYKTSLEYNGEFIEVSYALPPQLVTALNMTVDQHLLMMKVVQPYIDSSVSKTTNIPEDYPFEDFKKIYDTAWKYKLKGTSTYRPNDILGSVLSVDAPKKEEAPKVEEKQLDEYVKEMYSQPFESRLDGVLSGISVKGRFYTEQGEQKFIITINSMPIYKETPYGIIKVIRPVEFILTSNFTSASSVWESSMRFMSLMARSGVPLPKILENLKEITWEHGPIRYGFKVKNENKVPMWHSSDAATVGYIIEEALIREGFLDSQGGMLYNFTKVNDKYEEIKTDIGNTINPTNNEIKPFTEPSDDVKKDAVDDDTYLGNRFKRTGTRCPECNAYSVEKRNGCAECNNCHWIGSCG